MLDETESAWSEAIGFAAVAALITIVIVSISVLMWLASMIFVSP